MRLLALIKKEFLAIWRDPKSRAIIVVPPIIQLFIFANALTMEIRNVNVIVLDKSKTSMSAELIAGFEHSKWFRRVVYARNMDDVKRQIERERADMALIIDSKFADNLKKNNSAKIQIILDGRNTNTAGIINGYVAQIVSTYSERLSSTQRKPSGNIIIETRNWFNPNLEYRWFLLTSIVVMLSLVTTLNLTALSIARERELGTFDQLIVSPYTSIEILLGKTIPPLIISLSLVSVMILLCVTVFKLPFEGSFVLFLFSCFLALLSFVGIGLFISTICKTQQQAILGAFAFMMPAVLLSGFLSPIENMPTFVQYLTYANPIRFFMNISRGVILKDMPITDVLHDLIPLFIIAAVTLPLASRTFKRNLE